MNTSEIIDRYQRKHTSITVLAELNDCSPKEIKDILKDAGILRVNTNNIKMPSKLAAAHKRVCKDIQEEIDVHKNAAVAEEKAIKEERAKIKKIFMEQFQQYKEFEDIRKNNIQLHKDAVEILEKELKEEKDFYELFK